MLKLGQFSDHVIKSCRDIKGGLMTVTVVCKDSGGTVLGSIEYDCDSTSTRIQACKDAGHDDTTQTAGGSC